MPRQGAASPPGHRAPIQPAKADGFVARSARARAAPQAATPPSSGSRRRRPRTPQRRVGHRWVVNPTGTEAHTMLYAGLDLSRQRLDVHVVREDGTTALVTAVSPDADALRTLADRVALDV